MIGLRRHTVRLVEHDSAWAALFEDEARRVRDAAGDLVVDVQHVGSTAVPGLPAKPILDLAIAASGSDSIPELVRRLVAIGYIDQGDAGSDGGYLLVRESRPEVRVAHLHIVAADDPQWRGYVEFRDILRQDPAARERYADLKRQLTSAFPNDRRAYTRGKHDLIREILSRLAR